MREKKKKALLRRKKCAFSMECDMDGNNDKGEREKKRCMQTMYAKKANKGKLAAAQVNRESRAIGKMR